MEIMANWCYNDVRFYGNEDHLENLKEMLLEMQKNARGEFVGVLPDFLEEQTDGFFFDVTLGELDEDVYLSYLTRWKPNEVNLIKIAGHLQVCFVHDALEAAMGIYQRCKYTPGGQLVYAVMIQNEFGDYDFDRDSILPD